LLKATNRLAEAEPLMRRALVIGEQSFGPDHPNVAIRLNNLALLLKDTNRLAEAEPLMRRALEIAEQSFGPDHPNVAAALNNLAQMLQDTNRLIEAEPLMRRALEITFRFKATTGHKHPNQEGYVANFRQLLFLLGRRPDEVQAELKGLAEPFRVTLDAPSEQEELTAMRGQALTKYNKGDHAQAEAILRMLQKNNFEVPSTHCHLARVLVMQGKIDDAREEIRQGWEHRALGPNYVIPRILWFQLLFGLVGGCSEPEEGLVATLGRLKHALAQPDAHMPWTIQPVLERMQPRLAPDSFALLKALSAAIDDAANIPALDQFPAWTVH
jgi:tetratricopeptide (TPR) repeat protein